MTGPITPKQNPYTQRAIARAVKAALACGLQVKAILSDGTVLIENGDSRRPASPEPLTGKPKLRDAREKLGVH
ncbi:hypothetical protein ACVIIY_005067 [Bradyrhizobium sp. USDA 4515]|nr:hypothetical protein [Bradyrhizobium sp. USDA 4545]